MRVDCSYYCDLVYGWNVRWRTYDGYRKGVGRQALRTYVADVMHRAGQPDQALLFYVTATEEAETAANWTDVAAITRNWANA